MRVLAVADLPSERRPTEGIFVKREVEALRKLGLHVDVLPVRGRDDAFNYLRLVAKLRQRSVTESYDLIHAHYGLTGFFARAQLRRPLVVTYRGSDVLGIVGANKRYTIKGRIIVLLSLLGARWANSIIAVSREIAAKLHARVPVCVIPSGVDLDTFRPMSRREARKTLGYDDGIRLVLFAANPADPTKRFDLAWEAISLLAKQSMSDVKLVAPYPVPPEQMPLYMNACDVLLLTSMHEGFPNVVKEALACNLPVVSTAVGAVPTLLSGIDGCFLCSHSPADIANKIELALKVDRLAHGREAVEHLSSTETAKRVLQVYEDTLLTWRGRSAR